jgi:proteasome lid subunit RPN8/RPN11
MVSLTDWYHSHEPAAGSIDELRAVLATSRILGGRLPSNDWAPPCRIDPPVIDEVRGSARSPAAARPRPHTPPLAWRQVELRMDAAPVRTVRLAQSARDAIVAECERHADIETGGYLAGQRAFSWHREQYVPIAATAAARRTRRRVALDLDSFTRAEARFEPEGWPVVGDWHYHPNADNRPSEGDLKGWAGTWHDHFARNIGYLGLIVTLHGRRRVVITGWVTRLDRRDRFVCEPATVS